MKHTKQNITFRLKPNTSTRLDEIAKAAGISKGKIIENMCDALAADPYAMALYEVIAHSDKLAGQSGFINAQLTIIRKFTGVLSPKQVEQWKKLMTDFNAQYAREVAREVEKIEL